MSLKRLAYALLVAGAFAAKGRIETCSG